MESSVVGSFWNMISFPVCLDHVIVHITRYQLTESANYDVTLSWNGAMEIISVMRYGDGSRGSIFEMKMILMAC